MTHPRPTSCRNLVTLAPPSVWLLVGCVFCLMLGFLSPSPALADDPLDDDSLDVVSELDANQSTDAGGPKPDPWVILAERVRQDDSMRWIAVYSSQLAKLVPDNFRPVAISDLIETLQNPNKTESDALLPIIDQCDLVAVVRDDALISRASRVRLSSQAKQKQRFGQVSFSLSRLRDVASEEDSIGKAEAGTLPQARFETDEKGVVFISVDPSDVEPGDNQPSDNEPSDIETSQVNASSAMPLAGRELEWAWVQRGQPTWTGTEWQVSLPESSLSRLWIEVPQRFRLTCDQAVVRRVANSELPNWFANPAATDKAKSSSPAAVESSDSKPSAPKRVSKRTWALIESGGSTTLTLRLQPEQQKSPIATVVRSCRVTGQADGNLVRWQCRLVCDHPSNLPLPPWKWLNGEVTRVEMDGVETPFRWTPGDDSKAGDTKAATIELMLGEQDLDRKTPRTSRTILVEGNTRLSASVSLTQIVPLAQPVFPPPFMVAPNPWQVRLTLTPSTRATRWQLPAGWTLTPPAVWAAGSANGGNTWDASGPPPLLHSIPKKKSNDSVKSNPGAWSVEVTQPASLRYANHEARFLVNQETIEARCKIDVTLPNDRVTPIRLELQDGFAFESIAVGAARRTIAVNATLQKNRRVTIWPSADEISVNQNGESQMVIHASGQSRRDSSKTVVPELWLLRVEDCPGRLTSAVIPPAGMGWTAENAITDSRMEFSELNSDQRRFFAPLPGDAIVLGRAIRATPRLTLETPEVSISAACQSDLRLTPGGLEQQIQVQVEGLPSSRAAVRLRMAATSPSKPPKIVWQTRLDETSASVTINEASITTQWIPLDADSRSSVDAVDPQVQSDSMPDADSPQSIDVDQPVKDQRGWFEWNLPVSRDFNDQSMLIGRWIHQPVIDDGGDSAEGLLTPQSIGLVHVASAVSQTCELSLASKLQLARPITDLVGIPNGDVTSPRDRVRYRYESIPHALIDVVAKPTSSPANVVFDQFTHVLASAGGIDRVRTRFDMVATKPIEVDYPWEAHLVSIRINGKEIRPQLSRPRRLRFDPALWNEPLRVEVDWTTSSLRGSRLRYVSPPSMSVVGVTLNASTQVTAAADSFRVPWMGSDDQPLLVIDQWVMGLGWLGALFLLGVSSVAGWPARWTITGGLGLSILAMVMWPFVITPIATWVTLPLTVVMTRLATCRWIEVRLAATTPAASLGNHVQPPSETKRVGAEGNGLGADFSSSALMRSWIGWVTLVGCMSAGNVNAQTTDMLVPVDAENQPRGDKVYVTEAHYQQLFAIDPLGQNQPLSFVAADYRIELKSPTNRSQTGGRFGIAETSPVPTDQVMLANVDLLADLMVETKQPTDRLRLPFDSSRIIETVLLRPNESERVLATSADGRSDTLVSVPTGTQFRMRLRLRCQPTRDALGIHLAIALPPMPQSRLTVQCSDDVRSFRLITDQTAWPKVLIDDETASVTKTYPIGPCRELRMDYTVAPGPLVPDAAVNPSIDDTRSKDPKMAVAWNQASQWSRRFWFNVNAIQCLIECELQPRLPTPSGGQCVLVFQEDEYASPKLLSQNWKVTQRDRYCWTLTRVGPKGEPIRLGWERPLAWSAENQTAFSLTFPSIGLRGELSETPVDLGPEDAFGETKVAWTLDTSLRPQWPDLSAINPVEVSLIPTEQFYGDWAGTISRIDLALQTVGTLPVANIVRSDPSGLTVDTRQQIHVNESCQSIQFEANFQPDVLAVDPANPSAALSDQEPLTGSVDSQPNPRFNPQLVKLKFPPGARLLDWRLRMPGQVDRRPAETDSSVKSPSEINATTVGAASPETNSIAKDQGNQAFSEWSMVREGDYDCVIVRHDGRGMTITLDAELDLQRNRPNQLALVTLEPVLSNQSLVGAHEVILTRTANSTVKWKRPPTIESEANNESSPSSMLATGRVFADRWVVRDSIEEAFEDSNFTFQLDQLALDTNVRIALNWQDGRWVTETDIQIQSASQPDFLDVEIPTRWSDLLQIEPLCPSSRQPTLDPARQVIRIRLLDPGLRSVRLTSRLAAGESVRVGVPNIRVLQSRRSQTDVIVPNRLTNEPIRWRTSGVETIAKPRWDATKLDSPDDPPNDLAKRTCYAVSGKNWSVDLETLPKTDNQPTVVHADHLFFDSQTATSQTATGNGNLPGNVDESERAIGPHMLSRFDFLPGDASSLTLELPSGSKLVSAWINGQPAHMLRPSQQQIEFLLPVSRLGQSIEVLFRPDAMSASIDLPRWPGMKTPGQFTLTHLYPANAIPDQRRRVEDAIGRRVTLPPSPNASSQSLSTEQRWRILATSVVRSIAASSDSLADRRDEEVATWLGGWLQRYDSICRAAGVPFDPGADTLSAANLTPDFANRDPNVIFTWDEMESFLSSQIQRYAASDGSQWWRSESGTPSLTGHWSSTLTAAEPVGWIAVEHRLTSQAELPSDWLVRPRPSLSLSGTQNAMRFLLLIVTAFLFLVLRIQPHQRDDDPTNQQNGTNVWSRAIQRADSFLKHPATWIFVTGCLAAVFTPFSMALALMVTAFLLSGLESWWKPLLARRRFWMLIIALAGSHLVMAKEPDPRAASSAAPGQIADQMRFRQGWTLDLVAAEPMVIDPVAAAWDPSGRLWVVEMPDYPQPVSPDEPLRGRIQVLDDSDGDGKMDDAITFADGLDFATGVLPWPWQNSDGHWHDGAIVTLAGRIAWLRDLDGDGVCDDEQTWFRGFTIGNEQLRANHPTLGPDALVYVAGGLRGGTITAVNDRFDSSVGPIRLLQHDFCFDPKGGHWGPATGNSQHGLTIDDFGRRIGCSNRNPAIEAILQMETIQRDRDLAPSEGLADIAVAGEHSEVHPICDAWTTSHLHAGQFSAACGVLAAGRLADQPEWLHVCEPTGSLVQRQGLTFNGATWTATREDKPEEWLACENTWFRPVDLIADSSGGVLIIDMARAVIEHPDWAPDELKNRPDTWHGNDLGRIWRMKPTTSSQPSGIQIESDQDALAAICSDDPMRRSLATLHLASRRATLMKDSNLKSELIALLNSDATSSPAKARIASWLSSRNQLDESERTALAIDNEPRLRALAICLAKEPTSVSWNESLRDPSPLVRRVALEQFLLHGPDITTELQERLLELASLKTDPVWTPKLLASVPAEQLAPLIRGALSRKPKNESLRQSLLAWIHRASSVDPPLTWSAIAVDQPSPATLPLAAAWVDGLKRSGGQPAKVLASCSEKKRSSWNEMLSLADSIVLQPDAIESQRMAALTILLSTPERITPCRALIADDVAPAIRSRALEGLLRSDREWMLAAILNASSPWTADERGLICRVAKSDPSTAMWLLRSIADARLPRSFVDPATVDSLRGHRRDDIRALARQTFAPPQDRTEVLRQYSVVTNQYETADVENGRALFAQHCANCHRMENVGHMVGPDISDSRTKTAESLLVAILDPDAAIDASFTRYQVMTIDGEALAGLLHNSDSESITLIEMGNKKRRIDREDIETFRAVDASLMPGGIERVISVDQMADLIAYLKRWRYVAGGS